MTTAFLALTTAVQTALAAALPGVQVLRGRAVPAGTGAQQYVLVNIDHTRGQALEIASGPTQWETVLGIVLYQRAAIGSDAEASIDATLGALWDAVAAIARPSGVVGMQLDPAIQWDLDEADHVVASASLVLRITHLTQAALAAP